MTLDLKCESCGTTFKFKAKWSSDPYNETHEAWNRRAEYIEREALVHRLKSPYLFNITPRIFEIISEIPAADVAPVVHGRWDDSGRYTFPAGSTAVRCTNCGCALTESEYRLNNWNYRPVCGAKMDGKEAADG